MKPSGHFTGAALAVILLIVLIQAYLFETVLGAVLDGQHAQLPGALAVSAVLSAVALWLAFKAPGLDRRL
jgi:hypothetical protein